MACTATNSVKCFAIVFNTIVGLQSLYFILAGACLQYFMPSGLSIGILCVGVFLLILSIVACCGAAQENICLLRCYAIIAVILIALQIAAVIVASKMELKLSETLVTETLDRFMVDGNKISMIRDAIQQGFKCCGGSKGLDSYTGSSLPLSCCDQKQSPTQPCTKANAFQNSCVFNQDLTRLTGDIDSAIRSVVVGVGALGIVLTTIGLILESVLLCAAHRNINKKLTEFN